MDSLPLVDFVDGIGRNILEFLAEPARPTHLNPGHDSLFPQAKMQTRIVT